MLGKPLSGIFSILLAAAACAQEAAMPMVIRWVGSAYKNGDAFTTTATIHDDRVEVRWDGFSGPGFDFMDEGEKPRITRDLVIRDAETVGAFKAIAVQSELCDAGLSTTLGQGVSVEATVVVPEGTSKSPMRYFATEPDRPMAYAFSRLPWLMKEEVNRGVEAQIPGNSNLSQSARNLSRELARYADTLRLFEEAFEKGEELPGEALNALRTAKSLEQYREERRVAGSNLAPGFEKNRIRTEEILRQCFDRENRGVFIGESVENPGIVMHMVPRHSDSTRDPFPCLAANLGTPDDPVAVLPNETANLLMHFVTGSRIAESLLIGDACRLGFTPAGLLTVSPKLAREGGFPDVGRMKARLDFLNDKGIGRLLLGEGKPGITPVMVRITAIRFDRRNENRAKIDFNIGGETKTVPIANRSDLFRVFGREESESVVEVFQKDGRWKPGKVWKKAEYYSFGGVFHNDTSFRPDEGE